MPDRVGILLAYDTKKEQFDSMYDRNKFYRGLFGYKQTVKENGKVYRYEKDGLIGNIPAIKVEDSVLIVNKRNAAELEEYFKQWEPKVTYKRYKVILDRQDWEQIQSDTSSDAPR
jgi:hypothetical protein